MATKLTIEEIDEQIKKLNEAKEAIRKEEKERLEKEKESRKMEVDEALRNYLSVRDAYIKDYGYYIQEVKDKDKNRKYSDLWFDFFN